MTGNLHGFLSTPHGLHVDLSLRIGQSSDEHDAVCLWFRGGFDKANHGTLPLRPRLL